MRIPRTSWESAGFFFSPDYRIFPVDHAAREAGLAVGDRIVAIDGASPLTLLARVATTSGPIRYEVERHGRRFAVSLAPQTAKQFHWPWQLFPFAQKNIAHPLTALRRMPA